MSLARLALGLTRRLLFAKKLDPPSIRVYAHLKLLFGILKSMDASNARVRSHILINSWLSAQPALKALYIIRKLLNVLIKTAQSVKSSTNKLENA